MEKHGDEVANVKEQRNDQLFNEFWAGGGGGNPAFHLQKGRLSQLQWT